MDSHSSLIVHNDIMHHPSSNSGGLAGESAGDVFTTKCFHQYDEENGLRAAPGLLTVTNRTTTIDGSSLDQVAETLLTVPDQIDHHSQSGNPHEPKAVTGSTATTATIISNFPVGCDGNSAAQQPNLTIQALTAHNEFHAQRPVACKICQMRNEDRPNDSTAVQTEPSSSRRSSKADLSLSVERMQDMTNDLHAMGGHFGDTSALGRNIPDDDYNHL